MFEVVKTQPQFWVSLSEFIIPLADGEKTGLLEPAGGGGRRRERLTRLRARHKLGKPLKVSCEELAKEMRAREELGRDLKGRKPNFGVFLGQIGHDELVNGTNVGVRRPF